MCLYLYISLFQKLIQNRRNANILKILAYSTMKICPLQEKLKISKKSKIKIVYFEDESRLIAKPYITR